MIPKRVLVREPGLSFPKCVSSHPLRKTVDVLLARQQHKKYCEALIELGLELIQVPNIEGYPDSCFVEDTAIIHKGKVLIARMGAKSRRGEETTVEEVLKEYLNTKQVVFPGMIEGGDVVHLSDRLISGVTQRTNKEGITQMENWLSVQVDTCVDPSIVHLKSYVTFLGNDTMIVTKEFENHPVLKDFTKLVTPERERYAANTLSIGDTVLIPSNYSSTHSMVRDTGFDVVPLDMSEFEKCEGALTCLSLLF